MVAKTSRVMGVLLAASLAGCPGGSASRRGTGVPREVGGRRAVSSLRGGAGHRNPGGRLQTRRPRGQAQEAGHRGGRSRPGRQGLGEQVYFLDSQTRTFHRRGCPRLRGHTEIRQVRTLAQALDGGFRPCPVCRPDRAYLLRVLGPMPRPPVATPSQERACRRDGDCVLLPLPPCACPPCGWTWRRAVNRKHAEWLRAEWARESCPPTRCQQCADPLVARLGPVLGTRAVCRGGVCQVE